MERFQASWQAAEQKLKVADHILTMTYPLVKDPKLLLNVAMNIVECMEFALSSVLEFERLFKRIPPYQEDLNEKIELFENYVVKKHSMPGKYRETLLGLKEFIASHKDATVEFIRKDKMVVADEDYRLMSISPVEIQKHLHVARDFLACIMPLVTDERSAA